MLQLVYEAVRGEETDNPVIERDVLAMCRGTTAFMGKRGAVPIKGLERSEGSNR